MITLFRMQERGRSFTRNRAPIVLAVHVALIVACEWLPLFPICPAHAAGEIELLRDGFQDPPADCRPHTRWWWMGNALRKEDITWQLDQMKGQGIGGVEQITMEPVYTRGNHAYLSREYFELLRHAVEEAARRGMSFSINFGGPGWIWGGDWVPIEDRSKVLLASMKILEGPCAFSGVLPDQAALNPDDVPRSTPCIAGEDRLVGVVAAREEGGRLRADSLTNLTAFARGRLLTWQVPKGRWQVMAFWVTQRENANAVDHLSEGAMKRYCETLGEQYIDAIGSHFGRTVESFFGDSFEVPIFRNGIYWTDNLPDFFKEQKGYDLVPWLPALWWEVDDLSPKVRYDVNHALHQMGMGAFFWVFLDWCGRHGVKGRVQPYGFVTDVIEGTGMTPLPEMEITPGEKDAVPWFDTRIGPRAYVASGAHLYGRNVVSTEAFTYLHWEPYRATLEELKIATDGFLCAGANKFFNHGYIASPERDIVPTRGFYAAIRISHENIWWHQYHHLANYTARSCLLLRHGNPVADVAVYSPLANQWSLSVLNARKWTREFDFGCLGQLLAANGYGFDLVNDDVLQHRAVLEGGSIRLGEMTYRVLILPDISALPLESYRQVERFVRGGGRVIALERVPGYSTGMEQHATQDEAVRALSRDLFQPGDPSSNGGWKEWGQGKTCFLDSVLHRDDPLDWRSAALDPFLKALNQCVAPDMDITGMLSGRRNNEGLHGIHRRAEAVDLYFLANAHDSPVCGELGFRVTSGQPWCWDSHTGDRHPILAYSRSGDYTRIPLELAPFESRFIVFEDDDFSPEEPPHLVRGSFVDVLAADTDGFTALAAHNGSHGYQYHDGAVIREGKVIVTGIPSSYEVGGTWILEPQEGNGDGKIRHWSTLKSWTEDPTLRHFSGRMRYSLRFSLAEDYFDKDLSRSLSLGEVGSTAEIYMNGHPVGFHWRRGQQFDLGEMVKAGENLLEVDVTNTLINRVSGLEAFPGVQETLQPVFGSGVHDSFPEADALRGYGPLPSSGLIGPVRILPVKRIRVEPTQSK